MAEYLAYYSFLQVSADTRTGVLVVRSTGTGEERTMPLPTRVSSRFRRARSGSRTIAPCWSKSGDADGPGFGFYRFAIDTGNTELLARLPREVSSYDLSLDGKTIFYVLNVEDGQKLMRFDIEKTPGHGAEESWTFPGGLEIVSLAVSPDGAQLALTADRVRRGSDAGRRWAVSRGIPFPDPGGVHRLAAPGADVVAGRAVPALRAGATRRCGECPPAGARRSVSGSICG